MSTAAAPAPGVNRRTAIVASAVIVGLVGSGALVWRSTSAAFTATTTSPASAWATGTLALTNDKDSAGALFNVSGLVPGSTGKKCVTVTYGGNVATTVKLYAAGLTQTKSVADHLDLVVTQGTGTTDTCTDFSAEGAAIFSGTLSVFGAKTAFGTAVGSWTPSTAGTTKVYQVEYTLKSTAPDSTQGATAGVTFTWEAQSGS